jgi:hypothetical protein
MFFPSRPFHSLVMFAVKATSVHKSGAPERCYISVGSSLTHKIYSRLDRVARNKLFRVLETFVNYGCKKL